MIRANNLSLSFGSQKIFDQVSFTMQESDRIGLVGRNGSGKSTLLAAFENPSILDGGTITIAGNKQLAFMPQQVVLESDRSILDETMQCFKDLQSLKASLAELEKKISVEPNETILERYSELQEKISEYHEEQLQAQAKKMLTDLGFLPTQFTDSVQTLSVGWKMRIVLAKLLLKNADFYLFDEPTNHLDLITKEWFLDFLKKASFGFLLVCHERYFLDELCDSIMELELGKATLFTGNYSSYVVQKEQAEQLRTSAYIQQQKEIKQKQETIERFRAKASKAKMAQSMIKALDKIERITLPPQPKTVSFNFSLPMQSGKTVLLVKEVAQSFGSKKIFEHANFEINRGQKVAIIAPNGAGKTTLFNLICKKLPLQSGIIEFGYNVKYSIFAQEQAMALDGKASILENVMRACPDKKEQEIRTLLGSFLFTGSDVTKPVKVLSGGEKNRVGMAIVLLSNANLLLLDEPTNHLDIPSKEILLKALQQYQGTILFVSHDRDFVNQLATHIIELTSASSHLFEGNYDAYKDQKKLFQTPEIKAQQQHVLGERSNVEKNSKNVFELRKKITKTEVKIDRLEHEIKMVENSFAQLSFGTELFNQTQKKLVDLKKELQQQCELWETLNRELV